MVDGSAPQSDPLPRHIHPVAIDAVVARADSAGPDVRVVDMALSYNHILRGQ